MKILWFLAGVATALLGLELWSRIAPQRASVAGASVEDARAPARTPTGGGSVELRAPGSAPSVSEVADAGESGSDAGTRSPVVSEAALERRFVERLLAGLPPGWAMPVEPPTTGEGPSLGGVPHGEWTLRYPQHGWTDVGHFVLGCKRGVWRMFDASGELIRVRTFVDGRIHGTLRDRADPPGPPGPWRTYEYRDGEFVIE